MHVFESDYYRDRISKKGGVRDHGVIMAVINVHIPQFNQPSRIEG
jgi:hypothetical protein